MNRYAQNRAQYSLILLERQASCRAASGIPLLSDVMITLGGFLQQGDGVVLTSTVTLITHRWDYNRHHHSIMQVAI